MTRVPTRAGVSGHVRLTTGPRGSSWYAKYRLPNGRQVQRRLGPAWTEKGRPPDGYFTRRTAQEALAAILTDARRGTLTDVPQTGITFRDAAEEWLRYVEFDRQRRPSTVGDYRNLLNGALLPEFGDLPIEDVTVDRIDRYRVRLVAEGKLSARSINKRLVAIHAVFRRAQRVYGLGANPAAAVERQPMSRSGDLAVLTVEQVEALARNADDEQDAALYRVAAYTGLRLGELRALRWRDVDFGKQAIVVRRSYTRGQEGATKSGRIRSVPLSSQAAKSLDGLSRRSGFTEPDDLVFPNETGQPIDDSKLRRRFHASLDRAGLPRVRLHDLRHTFGTLTAAAFPIADVKEMLGHADIQTTAIYLHHVPRADAADRLSRLFTAVESNEATPDRTSR